MKGWLLIETLALLLLANTIATFVGAMAAVARCSSMCGGTGSWRRLCPPHHDDEPPCGVGKQWDGSAIRLPICPCVCPRLVPTPPT
jgi:hypothetical protein